MKILVTGANGFIGKALCEKLAAEGRSVFGAVRSIQHGSNLPAGVDIIEVGDIDGRTDWRPFLVDIHTVIHLAARVHVMRESEIDPQTKFRSVNVDGTAHLANTAAENGVRHFIYLSSIKVNGEENTIPYTEADDYKPMGPYAISKMEAELGLRQIEIKHNLATTILRTPLVYGPGVKANFLRLLYLVKCGIPLPLGSVANKRSLIYLGNLIDAIIACVANPNTAGQTYLISDDGEMSTPELYRQLAFCLERPSRLFPFPPSLILALGQLTGKSDVVNRLLKSLMIDSTKFRQDLNWQPPYTVNQGLTETAQWYKNMSGNDKR
jgi:nucleoside-diphosphate-sugar epimerase